MCYRAHHREPIKQEMHIIPVHRPTIKVAAWENFFQGSLILLTITHQLNVMKFEEKLTPPTILCSSHNTMLKWLRMKDFPITGTSFYGENMSIVYDSKVLFSRFP